MTISPQDWAYEIVSGGDAERTPEGLVPHEVRLWTSAQQQRDGLGEHIITAADGARACHLMNSFLMQIREQHQRIVRREDGYLLHSDQSRGNIWVPPEVVVDTDELGAFLKARKLPLGGYEPFRFPSYAGVEELLDGMWQHETYTLPLLGQVEANVERYIDVAIRLGLEDDERGTTLNLQVVAGSDDGYETLGSIPSISETFLSFGKVSGLNRVTGARFRPVAIANASVINAATSTFVGQFGETTAVTISIGAQDVDDAFTFTTVDADIESRVPTSAVTPWSFSNTWTNDVDQTTPDFTPSIQEIVERIGWASGQAVAMLFDGNPAATDRRRSPHSYESDSAKAPKFDVTFVEPSPPSPGRSGRHLPPGWGGPAPPPRGTGPGGGAAPSGAPPGTAPGYGKTHPQVRARQIADAICKDTAVDSRRHQSLELSRVQILHCLQGRGVPHAPQSAERSFDLIFRELGVARPRNVTLAQELDVIALNLP